MELKNEFIDSHLRIILSEAGSKRKIYSEGLRSAMRLAILEAFKLKEFAAKTADNWQPMETAPTTQPIILDIGMGWPVVGIYNHPSEKWVCAELQMGLYEGEYNDTYFENDHFSTPERWQPLPEFTR